MATSTFIKGVTLGEPISKEKHQLSKHDESAKEEREKCITLFNWYRRIHWLYMTQLVFIPLAGFIQAYWLPLHWQTAAFSVFYFYITGICITAGYHRLWAHRSYVASLPLRVYLAAFGAGAIEGSIKHWSAEHRAHHRYTDTDQDPYNVNRGVFHAHILWLLIRDDSRKIGRVDVADLRNDPLVSFQHRYYIPIAFAMGWAFPTIVAGLGWGDWYGGFIYAGILRTFFVNQATFCVNSVAHYLGDQPYDDKHTPRDHVLTSIITNGEGYHNFHHEFPSDYRNGIEWYHLDITKWMIKLWKVVGLASDLKTFRKNEIEKGKIQQARKKLDQKGKELDWGTAIDQLPVMEWNEFQRKVDEEGEVWIVIEGVVHDLAGFVKEHPGGRSLIQSTAGKDATAAFNGGIYDHSNAARNLLATMRVAILRGGGEVEIWK
ncbi:hypothetical protein AJ79_01572 [Helicocarpus griseus UAMH5409]|uniref:Acyl-CoA desaturase n=1 Tax=Helicocarpus griseus UAMH5409 TaxID=1447875 RepID=A0A2B7Y6F8_9EURO|nr:hypothetical protein AJ79_01572 [Helicocarpus griseus UAMH5409]